MADKETPGPVSYERFRSVNERLKATQAELAEIKSAQMRDRACQLVGLDLGLSDRVQGSTLDECIADARRLADMFGRIR